MLKFLQYLFTYRNLQQKAHWGWFHSLSFVKLPNLMATISSHLFLYPVKLCFFFHFQRLYIASPLFKLLNIDTGFDKYDYQRTWTCFDDLLNSKLYFSD